MVLINVSAISENEIKLEAPDMNPLIINTQNEYLKSVSCTLWLGEEVQCMDCGDEAAQWISKYCLKNESLSGLRLGLSADWKRSVDRTPWNAYAAVYKNLTSEDMVNGSRSISTRIIDIRFHYRVTFPISLVT